MELLLVRHGQSMLNAEKKIAGLSNTKLTEKGIKQAEEIRDKLKDVPIDIIICSPLTRAIQTANIINEYHNLEIIIDEGAIERNYGIYEGTSSEDETAYNLRYYTKNLPVEGGDDCKTYAKNVFSFLDRIIKEYKGKADTVLVVTHGFFLRTASWYFNGVPTEPEQITRIQNCQIDKYIV